MQAESEPIEFQCNIYTRSTTKLISFLFLSARYYVVCQSTMCGMRFNMDGRLVNMHPHFEEGNHEGRKKEEEGYHKSDR